MILYFSGTGNSRHCAQRLAALLGDECLDLFSYLRHGIAPELLSQTPWVVVSPTYAWQLPRRLVQLLRSAFLHDAREIYFVMTCGSDIGAAPAANADLAAAMGLTYRGTAAVVMPENYLALFPVPSEEKARAIVSAADAPLAAIAAAIRAGDTLTPPKKRLLDGAKSGFVNDGFYRYYISDKKFAASEQCVSCGLCADVCPLGNIRLEGGKPLWGGDCTHCMSCICRCPAEAIAFGSMSRGRRRYLCPEDESKTT